MLQEKEEKKREEEKRQEVEARMSFKETTLVKD
jgi:hypothetical protein